MKPQARLTRLTSTALLSGVAAAVALWACSGVRHDHAAAPVAPPIEGLTVSAYDAALTIPLPTDGPIEIAGLHNVYRLSENIVSGAEPHNEDAFAELAAMGIRTILSVDGKTPDEASAAKHGMKYVHVPIQYRGITNDELTKIAKTFREQPGPFYVHCFHGQHRGPAAAAVGRLVHDGASRERAIAEMRQWCGTSEKYEGLYRTIAVGQVPDGRRTARFDWDFPAAQTFEGFRAAMVEAARADDNLRYLSERAWRADAEHPDADPLNEAARLATVLRTTHGLDDVVERSDDFRERMRASVDSADALRDTVRAWRAGEVDIADVDAAYAGVRAACTACHSTYRN